ncbi:MAG: hypothetical protein IJS32_04305, partial [Kiritimatiellae bacterium]|nr:hypothetical protein [Kiritimatiellia bacterium]
QGKQPKIAFFVISHRRRKEEFPGEAPLAHFELGREKEPTAAEAAELAFKLRGAGWRVDQSQLEEATGYTLEREEQSAGGFGNLPMLGNKAGVEQLKSSEVEKLADAKLKSTGVEKLKSSDFHLSTSQPFNLSTGETNLSTGEAEPFNPSPLQLFNRRDGALLRSFAADTSEAAKRLAVLLEKADAGEDIAEEARKLAEELPGLMPEEPAMADELAAAMAEAFAGEIEAAKDAEDAKEGKLANAEEGEITQEMAERFVRSLPDDG